MRLAVDVMGGDNAPDAVLEGCRTALNTYADLHVLLIGDEKRINGMESFGDRVTVLHTDSVIDNDDAPVRAVRRKKDSSMVTAVRKVKEGEADACISAGNTGALMTAGLLHVGRIKGIDRPALSPMLPTIDGGGFLLLDVGANMEAKPEHLLQYAVMGDIYMKQVRGVKRPRIGLLNVGSEEGKGTELAKAAFTMMQDAPFDFVGNVESRELLDGAADVVVCDGFSGNLVLKSIEGTAISLFSILKQELTSSFKNKLAAAVLKPAFKRVKNKMDYSEYGGAGLFGLNAPVVKAHGSSDARAFFSAVKQAKQMHDEKVTNRIKDVMTDISAKEEYHD
ncbi:phosphate acyltransferase PlsX [Bacillus daqingensis]|uniref:Phosphate acyltransferase n=1 Tax=Bacillus daqingensis TaxID=872396 RepID=A0ABV9NTB6_9BACI